MELQLLEKERLDPLDAEHATWRLAFEAQGDPAYLPGDLLYLRWRNPREEVELVLDRFAAQAERRVRLLSGSSPLRPGRLVSTTLGEALTRHVDLQEATPELLARLAAPPQESPDATGGSSPAGVHGGPAGGPHRLSAAIARGATSLAPAGPSGYPVHLPSLLDHSGPPAIRRGELLSFQGRITGRPYTISRFERPREGVFRAEITVSEVTRQMLAPDARVVPVPGRSSRFLSILEPGERLEGWVLPERYHFPSALGHEGPVIVVCTGSGISGLLSLLDTGYEGGPLWLVYGVRSWKTKHLYGPRLEEHLEAGHITRMDVANSRPLPGEEPAQRVQGFLWSHRGEVADWLRQGAHIYLSGRLSMGKEVERTLISIIADQELGDGRSPAEILASWKDDLRFQASVSGV